MQESFFKTSSFFNPVYSAAFLSIAGVLSLGLFSSRAFSSSSCYFLVSLA